MCLYIKDILKIKKTYFSIEISIKASFTFSIKCEAMKHTWFFFIILTILKACFQTHSFLVKVNCFAHD